MQKNRDIEVQSGATECSWQKPRWPSQLKPLLWILISWLTLMKSESVGGIHLPIFFFCSVGNLTMGNHCSGSMVFKFERLSELPMGFLGHRFIGSIPRASSSAGLGETETGGESLTGPGLLGETESVSETQAFSLVKGFGWCTGIDLVLSRGPWGKRTTRLQEWG